MAILTLCTICLYFYFFFVFSFWSWLVVRCMFAVSWTRCRRQKKKKSRRPDKSYQSGSFFFLKFDFLCSFAFKFFILYFNKRGEEGGGTHKHTQTHLRIEDSCYFCNTTVRNSTSHFTAQYTHHFTLKFNGELNFAPCSGMALFSLKEWTRWRRETFSTFI